MPGTFSGSSESHSPEPWGQDRKDPRTVVDAQARLVAVTTMSGDAERILAGVNATRGLALPGLTAAPLLEAIQVLYEICRYNSDTRFRNSVDRRGGFEALLARANAAWRAFGEENFNKEGPGREPAVTPET